MIKPKDKIIEIFLLIIAFSAISVLFLITLFIFREGLPLLINYGNIKFLSGVSWIPSKEIFGILPFILGSICITIGALIFGVPLGIASAVYLAEFASPTLRKILKPAIELLAGIPSVVYGFIGVIILTPFIRNIFGGPGMSILAASIVLGIMILPTVISISIDSLNAVPHSYKEGSIALGATLWQTTRMVLLPSAASGILAGVILGMGRAIGETMAVIMIAGNAIQIPKSILSSVRTLTSNIALEMGFATGEHRMALFSTGVVLFIFIMILNSLATSIIRRKK